MPSHTARRELTYPIPADAPTISKAFETLANQLDSDVVGGQGKLSERPAAKLRGNIYVVQGDAIAANNGIVWWDTGATWLAVNLPGTGQAYAGVRTYTKAEAEAGVVTSTLRPAFVQFSVISSGVLTIGGVTVISSPTACIGYIISAGEQWKAAVEVNVSVKLL
jgi:hypothetical protein